MTTVADEPEIKPDPSVKLPREVYEAAVRLKTEMGVAINGAIACGLIALTEMSEAKRQKLARRYREESGGRAASAA